MNEYRGCWRNAPTQWYLVLFLIMWCVIFLIFSMVLSSEISQGTDTNKHLVEDAGYVGTSYLQTNWAADDTGRIYQFYATYGDGHYHLNFTYTDDNFLTWTNGTVATDWNSWTVISSIRALATSNGSIVVGVYSNKPSTYNFVIFIHYKTLPVTTWVPIQVYGSGSYPYTKWDMAVDPWDNIRFVTCYTSAVSTRMFNFTTSTLSHATNNLGENWRAVSALPLGNSPMIRANSSGIFWIAFQDGTNSYCYFRDYAKTQSEKSFSATVMTNIRDFVILLNDVMIVGGEYYFGSTWSQMSIYTQTAPYTYTWVLKTMYPSSVAASYKFGMGSFSINYQNKIYFMYIDTIDFQVEFVGPFEYDWFDWQIRNTLRVVGTYGNNAIQPWFGGRRIWPQSSGVSFEMPYQGYLYPQSYKDNIPGGSYTVEIWINGTNFTLPSVSYPAITTTTMTPGYASEPYVFDFSVTGGNSPYFWTVISSPGDQRIDADGRFYGWCPSSTGTYEITVRVTDGVNNYDELTFDWVISERSTGGEVDTEWSWGVPSVDFNGTLWVIFIFSAFFAGTYRIWSAWVYKEAN